MNTLVKKTVLNTLVKNCIEHFSKKINEHFSKTVMNGLVKL